MITQEVDFSKASMYRAIKQQCLDCLGGDSEVRKCEDNCPLHNWRCGRTSTHTTITSKPEMYKAIKRFCENCMGGVDKKDSWGYVKKCQSQHCPLWPYRFGHKVTVEQLTATLDTMMEKPKQVERKTVEPSTFRCPSCDRIVPWSVTGRHHIWKRADGGTDDPANLIRLCRRCHDLIEPLNLPRPEIEGWFTRQENEKAKDLPDEPGTIFDEWARRAEQSHREQAEGYYKAYGTYGHYRNGG